MSKNQDRGAILLYDQTNVEALSRLIARVLGSEDLIARVSSDPLLVRETMANLAALRNILDQWISDRPTRTRGNDGK